MAENRINALMLLAAENLERGCEPLNHQFLVEHDVTIDECDALAKQMAVAIKAFVRTPADESLALIVRGTYDDEDGQRDIIVERVRNGQAMRKTIQQLGALSKQTKKERERAS